MSKQCTQHARLKRSLGGPGGLKPSLNLLKQRERTTLIWPLTWVRLIAKVNLYNHELMAHHKQKVVAE
jgi:hypothetical protein